MTSVQVFSFCHASYITRECTPGEGVLGGHLVGYFRYDNFEKELLKLYKQEEHISL